MGDVCVTRVYGPAGRKARRRGLGRGVRACGGRLRGVPQDAHRRGFSRQPGIATIRQPRAEAPADLTPFGRLCYDELALRAMTR
jgi:hypothetical protein